MNQNELCHYGIQGMKWGVRRYQLPNGSLTKAGKNRYKETKNGYEKIRGRSLRERSADRVANDLELMKATYRNRMNMMSDRQYKSYDKASKYWSARSAGKNTPHRGLIKRLDDRDRSLSLGERAAKSMLSGVVNNVRTNKTLEAMGMGDQKKSAGKIAADSVIGTAGSLAMDELLQRAFGHF